MNEKILHENIPVEETFNGFIEDFGGELISKLFIGQGTIPLNADYFLDNRSIVAELKCIEKNYFDNQNAGQKVSAMINEWIAQGRLQSKHIRDGRIHINDIGRDCAEKVFNVFLKPVKDAIEKANKQIKETKRHFGLTNARGLLILANDGNYSLTPQVSMNILGNLLPRAFTGIDSFIYFTPNMRLASSRYDRQAHVWISGAARPRANAIDADYLNKIQVGWVKYLARLTGEDVTVLEEEDPDSLELTFVRDDATRRTGRRG